MPSLRFGLSAALVFLSTSVADAQLRLRLPTWKLGPTHISAFGRLATQTSVNDSYRTAAERLRDRVGTHPAGSGTPPAESPPPPPHHAEDDGTSTWIVFGVAGAVVLLGVAIWWRRRAEVGPAEPTWADSLATDDLGPFVGRRVGPPPQQEEEVRGATWVLVRPLVRRLRITRVPPGRGPLDIRAKWLGVELSTRDGTPKPVRLVGANSGQFETLIGYTVDAGSAMASLAIADPDAAAWWHRNAVRSFEPGTILVFSPDCCEVCG